MGQLAVTTCTTVEELALFIQSSPPDSMLAGVPREEGVVMLYAADAGASGADAIPLRERLAARVAVDVVLQRVAGMPGAVEWLRNVEEQFEGDYGARIGWLSPPLTILSRIYRKTMNPLPGPSLPGHRQHYFSHPDGERDDPSPSGLMPDQVQAIEHLIDKLFLLPGSGKVHGKLEDAGTD